KWLPLLLFMSTALFAKSQPKPDIRSQMKLALQQYQALLAAHPDITQTPHSFANGKYVDKPADWWCSGFFAGNLWFLYQYTYDEQWKTAADKWTRAVEQEQYNTGTHDLGFMLYCSFGNGYRLTGNPLYKQVLLQGAKSLATRFNPKSGVIKSWDRFGQYDYPVIIDNMMNLEFLLWAAKASGLSRYYDIAVSHADVTMKNHYRPDHSSYHVVCYDSVGNVLAKKTAQGANDTSAWARGQAWGLYGFTVMYRETKDKKYLQQAKDIADFFIHHPNLPADKIPYWDFNAPNIPNEERDAAAGAIACSALLELYRYVGKDKAKEYFDVAEKMLTSLSGPDYRSALGENGNFLIKHCVSSKPGGQDVDAPLIYADYYYLEALLRYDKALFAEPSH
ncbi:MAG TPA: glycoside hydrolase family 88 protein, partial [Puia sp.]|nr:glycoside hydrolase family 88 protein [Puia sp.]